MPTRRKGRRRKKSGKGKGPSKPTKKYVKAVVNKAIEADPHHVDTVITDVAVNSTTTYVHQALACAVGDTQQSRNGKMVRITGVSYKCSAYRNASSTSHDRMRVFLVKVKDMSAITTLSSFYNLLYDTDLVSTTTQTQTFRRLDAGLLPNFKILYDKTIDLGYGATDKSTKVFNINIKFKRPVRAWFNTDATASPITNNLLLCAISDVASAASPPLLSSAGRVWFLP